MDGFKRPVNQRPSLPKPEPPREVPVTPVIIPADFPAPVITEASEPKKLAPSRPKKRLLFGIFGSLALVCVVILSVFLWYFISLSPVNAKDTTRQRITIDPGSSLPAVAKLLKGKHLIRSDVAFTIYARSVNAGQHLQAGNYSLSPSESTKDIIARFTGGAVDQFSITFLPGATLRRLPGETSPEKTDIESTLLNAGYSKAEIETAFNETYDSPLFDGKPAGTDLEGYIYGETYDFASNTSVEQILTKVFEQYYQVVQDNNLIDGFKKQGLSLYQGITLASIIQREVSSPADQRQVAQIFFSRLHSGISLGSDVTFQYAAKKANVTPSPDLDSPYNTRKFTGLPPGPISMPGLSALKAVADPASGDYLYFLAGDDGVTYFAKTYAEHQANINNHCQKSCAGS